MELKKKDMLSGSIFLVLIILLSQSRLLDMLFDNLLGRSVLVATILAISYTNNILGVVSVMVLIIAFSGLKEGFEPNSIETNMTDALDNLVKKDVLLELQKQKEKQEERKTSVEGYTNFLEGERRLQKGKSSAIPVDKRSRESGDVKPFDNVWESISNTKM